MMSAVESKGVSKVIDINRFNKLGKLLRVASYVKRFIENLKKKKAGNDLTVGKVSVEELKSAEIDWIKDVQTKLQEKNDFEKTKVQLGIVTQNEIMVCTQRTNPEQLRFSLSRRQRLPENESVK